MSIKHEKIVSLVRQLAAYYLEQQSNGISLITVTDCQLSEDSKYATIFITVFPDRFEEAALNFAKRQRADLRNYIKEKAKMGVLPFIEIELDQAEKQRQRIDDLLKKG